MRRRRADNIIVRVPAYPRWDLNNLPESNLEFLVKPYFVKRGLTLVVGEGGASKSWLMLDLAIAGALEQCWMGQQCHRFSSLIFDEDGSEIESVRRFKRLCAARDVAANDPRLLASFSMIPAQGLKLDDLSTVQRVQDTIGAYSPDFVIFDALVAIHGREENSNNEMKLVMRDRIRALMRNTGVTVALVHHLGKSSEVTSGIGQIRGATEIVNASDAALLAKSEEGGHRLSMVRSKMIPKDDWPKPLEYSLTDDADSTYICLRRMTDDQLRAMYAGGKTYRQLEAETGISKSRLNRIIGRISHG